MSDLLTNDAFAAMPLDAQLQYLDKALREQSPRDLFDLCASVRDNAPLAHLSARVYASGWFAEEPNRAWFATFLIERTETAVNKVLKTLIKVKQGVEPHVQQQLSAILLRALEIIPLSRLSSMCLIDRAMYK